jgi:hypothetical protein
LWQITAVEKVKKYGSRFKVENVDSITDDSGQPWCWQRCLAQFTTFEPETFYPTPSTFYADALLRRRGLQ